MLKTIFDVFQVTEAQVTSSALRRLKLASIVSIPALPLAVLAKHGGRDGALQVIILTLAAVSVLALLLVASSRIANRLWIPERYLDEAEITRKRKSASLAYQCVHLMSAVFIIWFVLAFNSGSGLFDIFSDGAAFMYLMGTIMTVSISLQTLFACLDMAALDSENVDARSAADKYYKYGALAAFLGLFAMTYLLSTI